MHVKSDKLQCPTYTNTEQCMSYRTSYDVLQTTIQNNECQIRQATISLKQYHIKMHVISDKLRCPSDTNTEQCISYLTSYDVLQTLTQNNACHIGQATLSFRYQHRTMHVISDKLRCPSDTNTEQCMSYRTSYDVLQTPTQNNAYHIGQATMSFIQQHRTMHVKSDSLQCPKYIPTQNNAWHIGQATMSFRYQHRTMHVISRQTTMSFRYQHRTMHVISDKLRCPSDTNTEQCMSYRTSYDVLQTTTQNNACQIGQATISLQQYHIKMHVISDKLRCPSDTNTEQCMSYLTS
jgi:flagellar basal body rod protein FlgC